MNELIKQHTRWMHYIGGYYRSHHAFIREAKVMGISRRIPAQVARGMNYGDTVVLLRYCSKKRVYAFAEMIITGLVLSGDIAQAVGEKLQAQGKATYTAGGGMISRECGSYMIMGTWNVDAELSEVMDIVTATQCGLYSREPYPTSICPSRIQRRHIRACRNSTMPNSCHWVHTNGNAMERFARAKTRRLVHVSKAVGKTSNYPSYLNPAMITAITTPSGSHVSGSSTSE
jgi:hypothetical protein